MSDCVYILNPRTVDAFDYNVETGEIKNRRTAINVQSFEPFEHVSDTVEVTVYAL